jgi:P-loop containing dynein motor region D4
VLIKQNKLFIKQGVGIDFIRISIKLNFYSGFLELINNMLTSGMVPALYSDEEKEQIIGQVGC